MKKIAKLSLVAAVAVAGLTSANATALEESIKNVDFSGTMVYRYDDRDKDGGDLNNNSYKIVTNVKSKVNDDISANVSAVVGAPGDNHSFDMAVLGGSGASKGSDANQDGGASVNVSKANFAYTGVQNTTIIAGKQGLGTPFTVASDAAGNEQTGTGILALSTVGPVTVAAGYFNNHNTNASGDYSTKTTTVGNNTITTRELTDGSEDVTVAAVMGNLAGVALDAWYTDVEEVFNVYTLGAKYSLDISGAKLTAEGRHSALDLDGSNADNSLTKVDLGLKVGIFGANIGYGFTNNEGGTVALDNDASAAYQGWALNLNGVNDASLLKLNVNVDVLPNLNLAANYNVLDYGSQTTTTQKANATATAMIDDRVRANKSDKEYYGQATYKMSKNFMTYVRVGQVETEGKEKGTRGRLHVQYTF